MRSRNALLLGLTLLAFLVAGCTDGADLAGIKGLAGVPTDAPSEIGSGDTRLVVRTVMETFNGTPVPGAAIAVYEIPNPIHPIAAHVLKSQNTSLAGRTDANGEVVVHLDSGTMYTIVAQGNSSTVEAAARFYPEKQKGPIIIRLYESQKGLQIQGVVPPTTPQGVPLMAPQVKWFPRGIFFHPDPKVNDAYFERIALLTIKLAYPAFAPEGGGDLGMRLGFTTSYCIDRPSGNTIPLPTNPPVVERTQNYQAPQVRYGLHLPKAEPRFGPTTTNGVWAPQGIAYTIGITAGFGTDPLPEYRYYGACSPAN